VYTVLDPNVPNAAENMRWLVAGIYIIGALIMLISICVIYNLNKKTVATMTQELNERREATEKTEAKEEKDLQKLSNTKAEGNSLLYG
jgi:Na+/melibiose symporter-like transporter